MVVAIAGLAAFITGFTLGLLTLAFIQVTYKGKIEAKVRRQVMLDQARGKIAEEKMREVRVRLRERYGDDLSAQHQEIADEEIVAILGAVKK